MKQIIDSFYPTILTPYNGWSDKYLSIRTMQIKEAMTGNVFFPSLATQVTDYGDTVVAYNEQLAKAATRDMNAVAAKNVRRKELIAASINLGIAVAQIAAGDLEMLISSRFPLRRIPQSLVLSKPENLRISYSLNKGELIIKVDSMLAARSFIFEFTIDPQTPASNWTKISCSTSRCVLKGLESGKKYWVRVAAVGSKDQLVWGDTMQSPYVE